MRRAPLALVFLGSMIAACGGSEASSSGSGGGTPATTSGAGGHGGSASSSSGGAGGSTASDGSSSTTTTSTSTSTSSAGGGGASASSTASTGAGGAGGAMCAPVTAAPDVDSWSVRAPSAGFGAIVTQQNGGHSDVFLESPAQGNLPQNYIRVGARLDWGGSIVFFGLGANAASNVIDANDTGRELQIALYDPTRAHQPCAATATCVSSPASCGNSITYLGWDPVQGGDECGHGGAATWSQQGDALRLVVHPLQWNPDWDQPSCATSACGPSGDPVAVTYTLDLRFVTTHVVEVATEITSQEAFDHPKTGQEFPTLYVAHGGSAPDLPVLLDGGGQTVTIATPANDGFFVGELTSPTPWVSWQDNAKDYGVGLAMDQGIHSFQAWRGDGNTAPYFHNVRAHIAFGVGAGKAVRGVSYLALGSFSTVGAELGAVLKKRPPFGAVDAPASGGTTSYAKDAPIHVAGWALDTVHVASVRVEIDGATAATLPVSAARPDVCATYPDYDGCPIAGFDGDVPTTGLGPCPHLLRVVAEDADGNATTLGERVVAPAP